MKVNVYMTAFLDRDTVREVEIPDPAPEDAYAVLEIAFYYGQNDFQRRNVPSVSVGDVAELRGKLYVCAPVGWREVTREWFDGYAAKDAKDRRFSVRGQWAA